MTKRSSSSRLKPTMGSADHTPPIKASSIHWTGRAEILVACQAEMMRKAIFGGSSFLRSYKKAWRSGRGQTRSVFDQPLLSPSNMQALIVFLLLALLAVTMAVPYYGLYGGYYGAYPYSYYGVGGYYSPYYAGYLLK